MADIINIANSSISLARITQHPPTKYSRYLSWFREIIIKSASFRQIFTRRNLAPSLKLGAGVGVYSRGVPPPRYTHSPHKSHTRDSQSTDYGEALPPSLSLSRFAFTKLPRARELYRSRQVSPPRSYYFRWFNGRARLIFNEWIMRTGRCSRAFLLWRRLCCIVRAGSIESRRNTQSVSLLGFLFPWRTEDTSFAHSPSFSSLLFFSSLFVFACFCLSASEPRATILSVLFNLIWDWSSSCRLYLPTTLSRKVDSVLVVVFNWIASVDWLENWGNFNR